MDCKGKKAHHCEFCDFTSAKKYQIESHVRTHTREKSFFCEQCKRRFSHKKTVQLHIRTVHKGIKNVNEKKHKCFLCPYATHRKGSWTEHTQAHLGERSFTCQHPGCTYAAKTSSTLRMHNINKHRTERKYLCPFPNCGYRTKTRTVLKQHHETHSKERRFACDFEGCTFRSKNKGYLQKHKRCAHEKKGFKPFKCTLCNCCTSTSSELIQHQISHKKEKPVKCQWSGCDFSCRNRKNLQLHVLNCHTDKIIKCDFEGCHSTLASMLKLEHHKKIVHYDKAYKCPNCEYRAAMPSILQLHIGRVHNVSKRIPCPTKGCAFRAKHRWTLDKHMRYHKANLGCPFEGCGYVAHTNSSLRKHVQVHNPRGRPFSCPLCPKYFSNNDHLSQHLKTHTQEKPFQCPVCNFGAVLKSNIIKHVGLFHQHVSATFDEASICDHCGVNFGSVTGLAVHRTKFKTAVVVLTRFLLKI